ncbi:MAG: lactate utilization protein [Bacteroidetes bacterium]|nr:lactate utilization protein [Bacteroidota bacterium]
MKETTSREQVLKKIRNALMNNKKQHSEFVNVDFESPIYATSDESPEMSFAQKFTALTGKFAFCEDYNEFSVLLSEIVKEQKLGDIFCTEPKLIELLEKSAIKFSSVQDSVGNHKASITFCEALISRTGSIMVTSMQASGRKAPVAPDIHFVVAYTSQFVDDIKDGFETIKKKYGDKQPSMISLITGPSRTADIEKTLVLGAHGPKEMYIFLFDDSILTD